MSRCNCFVQNFNELPIAFLVGSYNPVHYVFILKLRADQPSTTSLTHCVLFSTSRLDYRLPLGTGKATFPRSMPTEFKFNFCNLALLSSIVGVF